MTQIMFKRTGEIEIEKNYTLGYIPITDQTFNLKPFDLIYFCTTSNLKLLSDYNVG